VLNGLLFQVTVSASHVMTSYFLKTQVLGCGNYDNEKMGTCSPHRDASSS